MNADYAAYNAEIDRLMTANGGHLTEHEILEAATPANSVLHPWFNWDDAAAGHRYRLDQARRLIKVFNTQVRYTPTEVVVVPTYVSEASDGERSYVRVVEVISDADRRRALVLDTLKRAVDILRNCPEPICQRLADRLTARRDKV